MAATPAPASNAGRRQQSAAYLIARLSIAGRVSTRIRLAAAEP